MNTTTAVTTAMRILPVLLIVALGLGIWQNNRQESAGPAAVAGSLTCQTLATGCATSLNGSPVTVGMTGELKPLVPFQVWVRAPGARKIEASFTMEGMNMGFNLYTLRADAQGVFRATVTLPACVSGRRNWVMALEIDRTILSVPFVTEL